MDLPLSAGFASPMIRRANLEDRASALRRHGETAIGLSSLTSPRPSEFRKAAESDGSLSARSTVADGSATPSSRSSGSVLSSPLAGLALGDSFDIKRVREQRANAALNGDATRIAILQAATPLRRTFGANQRVRLGGTVSPVKEEAAPPLSSRGGGSSSSRMPSPVVREEASDVDLELRLFAALQPSGSPATGSRSLPRQGRPIPSPDPQADALGDALEELVKAEVEGHRRRESKKETRIAEGTQGGENKLQRKGTAFPRKRGTGGSLSARDDLDESGTTDNPDNSKAQSVNASGNLEAVDVLKMSISDPLKETQYASTLPLDTLPLGGLNTSKAGRR